MLGEQIQYPKIVQDVKYQWNINQWIEIDIGTLTDDSISVMCDALFDEIYDDVIFNAPLCSWFM